jgi:hypothetical protein
VELARLELLAMQKVEGSSPFSRSQEVPVSEPLSHARKPATPVASGFCMAISSWLAMRYA